MYKIFCKNKQLYNRATFTEFEDDGQKSSKNRNRRPKFLFY